MAYARRTFGGNMQIGDLVRYLGDGGGVGIIKGFRPNGYDCYVLINGQTWLVTIASLEVMT